jgi:hypothetical protein
VQQLGGVAAVCRSIQQAQTVLGLGTTGQGSSVAQLVDGLFVGHQVG